MLKLHDFFNRAVAVTLDALMMIVIDIGCQRGQRDLVDHFPVRSQGRLTALVVGERPASRKPVRRPARSEEPTSELPSLMRISYAVFCLKKHTNYQQYTPHSYFHPLFYINIQ